MRNPRKTNFKYIMGLQSISSHAPAVSIVKFSDDGQILDFVAIAEERLIRKKYPYVFPIHSIGYCMDYFGLKDLSQIDLFITDYIRLKRWFNSGPTYNISEYDYLKIKFDIDPKKIRTITHHLAHAASTYYASGFDESAILVVDGNGSDMETTSYFKAKGFEINPTEIYRFHGIGACYNVVTNWILGLGIGGEGKTMGLAPYGSKYKKALHINTELNGIKNDFSKFMTRLPYSDVLDQVNIKNCTNPLRKSYRMCNDKKDLLNPYFSRVAFDIQKETERVLVHLAKDLHRKTKSKNLCIAGGVGLNSVSNKIILDKAGFDNVFCFPACSDEGIPFGLAMWGYYNCKELGNFKRKKLKFRNTYTGKEYPHRDIINTIKRYKIPYEKAELKHIAKLISKNKIVGWFQGRSEYGPRALGHRSILADSRNKNMKDILNSNVKHRESFRPYAPSILREQCEEYFDLKCESKYMLLIAKVKKPKLIPSITHVDNTARIQTVTKEDNGIFYDLISEFYKITGVPCILNTSFNDAGEPIVETPEDAIIRFLGTNMDYLVIEDYMFNAAKIDKRKRQKILKQMTENRENKIKTRERFLIKKHFKGYDRKERDRFVSESNKISEWYVKYKCKYELEKKILEWTHGKKRILIIGEKNHTDILPKYINGFGLMNIVAFCDHRRCSTKTLKRLDYDEILISSYEHNFKIYDSLKKMNLKKPIYAIYDNTSRSFMDLFGEFPAFKYNDFKQKAV